MDANALLLRLEHFPRGLVALVESLSEAEVRWKPPSGNFSILEVLCHLADEEVEDFRARVVSTLTDPAAVWPTIDPTQWPAERNYAGQSPHTAMHRFMAARAESLRQLRLLAPSGRAGELDWSRAYQHPKVGPVAAGELLTAWAAHDALHLRQIAKRLFELAARDGGKYPTTYAGEWKA
jgi:hypothetical protein